jgi:hypothetical protein
MSGLHRICCCGELDCPAWVACLPAQITVSGSYTREYTTKDNGQQYFRRYEQFTFSDVVLQFNAATGCMEATGEGGTFTYELRFEQSTYPRAAYYVDDCPPCSDIQPCTEEVTTASGPVGVQEIRICCYDPCNTPNTDYPANTLDIELYATGTQYFNSFGECVAAFGPSIPPYPTPIAVKARMYGQWECLDALTFQCRAWDENYWHANAPFPPAALDNTFFYPQGICAGAYAIPYQCIGFGTPRKTSYNLLCESAPSVPIVHFDVTTCDTEVCVDEHECWSGMYGGTGTLVFRCGCDDCGGGGGGGGIGNSNGCVSRVYRDQCSTSFSATVP